jgi:hypothetical protein
MHTPQVASIGSLRVGVADNCWVNRGRVGQLRKGGQNNSLFAKSSNTVRQSLGIHNSVGQTELVFKGGSCL